MNIVKLCFFVLVLLLTSCEVETPGGYEYDGTITNSEVMNHINESLHISDEKEIDYPEIGSIVTNNIIGLENSRWVLTKMRRGGVFLTNKNDKIFFIDKLNYELETNGVKYYGKYSLYNTFIGLTLTLKSFAPFGGGTYSANIYKVNSTIIINEAKFTNDYDLNDLDVIATFEKQ